MSVRPGYITIAIVFFISLSILGRNQGESTSPQSPTSTPPYPFSNVITDISLAPDSTIIRKAQDSDCWPITWGDDDNLYTAYGDGKGFIPNVPDKLSLGFARVIGSSSNFAGENIRSPSGEQTGDSRSGKKASGMLMIDGVLYMWVRNANHNGQQSQLAWSTDYASTWTWSNWKFQEFGYPCFLNFGKNYSGARDEYVYMYSPDTPDAYDETDSVILGRVHKSQITDKNAYEFFQSLDSNGNPVWTSNISQRGAVFNFPGGCNRLDVVYNAPLQRYIMTMRSRAKAGGLNQFSIYDAAEPWGPWTTVYYETQTSTTSGGWGESQHFPSKWISSDGKTMYSVFSGDDAFSVRKATLTATAGPDTIPPYILNVSAEGDSTRVLVSYSEPVEETSATDITNYTIDNGIMIFAATLQSDSSTVALTTSPHTGGVDYILTVNNVLDRAAIPNSIAPNTQVAYQYISTMTISNLTVASNRNYTIGDNLQSGDMAYIDRNYTYQSIPSSLSTNYYIRTANDDKLSQGAQFLSFEVNQPVTVFVCHDNRYQLKPDWLSQFNNTQQTLFIGSAEMTIFEKDFPTGTIILGGNVHPQEPEDNNMYTVVIAPSGVTGLLEETKLPHSSQLGQNYPNPANPTTTIPYRLEARRHVQLSIYNLLGQKIKDLVNTVQSPGEYKVEWNGKDRFGRDAASGIYFYLIKTGAFENVKRLTLIR